MLPILFAGWITTRALFLKRMILQGGRAILGGGHYGNLVSAVGGDPLPGIGFAMGDVMSRIVLEKYGCIPAELTRQADQVLVTVFDESFLLKSFHLAAELRECWDQSHGVSRSGQAAETVEICRSQRYSLRRYPWSR
jgi:histidyl-tRNA synthetase